MKTCIIYNPFAGRRQGERQLQVLRECWGSRAELMPTTKPGHAEELALRAAGNGFGVIAAAGGDGTAHEVANGILRSGRADVHFALLPIGSANDYAFSVNAGWSGGAGSVRRVDVGEATSPDGRKRYFICCLGLGFNGLVTLESRKIRWLRGMPLYGLATLRALWRHHRCPPLEIAFDEQPATVVPTLMLTVLLGQREGNFVMAPRASLDDGWFDYVHSGDLSRWEVLKLLPRLALKGPPEHHAKVWQGQCRRVQVRSQTPLIVHIDGEFFCTPQDHVLELAIRILPGALSIQRLE